MPMGAKQTWHGGEVFGCSLLETTYRDEELGCAEHVAFAHVCSIMPWVLRWLSLQWTRFGGIARMCARKNPNVSDTATSEVQMASNLASPMC